MSNNKPNSSSSLIYVFGFAVILLLGTAAYRFGASRAVANVPDTGGLSVDNSASQNSAEFGNREGTKAVPVSTLAPQELVVADAEGIVRIFDNVDKDGTRVRIEHYLDDSGKRVANGKYENWYPNGDLRVAGEYRDGLRNGKWSLYGPGEQLMNTRYYAAGKLDGEFIFYHRNGTPSKIGELKDGKKEGVWQSLTDDGKPFQKVEYQNDKPVGMIEIYGRDGKVVMKLPAHAIFDESSSTSAANKTVHIEETADCNCGG